MALEYSLTQEGFRALLESQPDFKCVGKVGEHFDTIAAIDKFAPDVVLVELGISSTDHMNLVREIQIRGNPRVLVVLRHANEHFLLDALRLGTSGCVLKNSSREELFEAIRNVKAGRPHVTEGLERKVVQAFLRDVRSHSGQSLTKREQMIFQAAAEGCTSSQIAELYSISSRTAECHRARILRKLGLKSQTELVRYAIRRGVIKP